MPDNELEHDLKKYESDYSVVQSKLNELEMRKQELVRLGTRLEGAIAYIKLKISETPKSPDQT